MNEYVRRASDFKAALTGAGVEWKKTRDGNFYSGIKLKNTADYNGGFYPVI